MLSSLGRIIDITGNALPEDIDMFIECGADRVIVKPISRDKLQEVFIEQLNNYQFAV